MSSARLVSRQLLPEEFVFARMSEHDLLEIVEIEETCGLSLWGWDAYRAELDRPEAVTFVARARGRSLPGQRMLAGFVAARLNADELHINNIGVRVEARRLGVGGALLAMALERGERMGATRALLEVRRGNIPAQRLYGAYGFEQAGVRRNYYREPVEDALVMTRSLGDDS